MRQNAVKYKDALKVILETLLGIRFACILLTACENLKLEFLQILYESMYIREVKDSVISCDEVLSTLYAYIGFISSIK